MQPANTTSAPASHTQEPDLYPKKYGVATWAAIGGGLLVIAIAIGLVIGALRSHQTANQAASASQSASTGSSAATSLSADSTANSSSASVQAAASAAPSASTSASQSTGTLMITASPIAACNVDGIARGRTPIALKIASGAHLVTCTAGSLKATETAVVEADKQIAVHMPLAAPSPCNPPFDVGADGVKHPKPECATTAPATAPKTQAPPPNPPLKTATKACDPVMENCK
jgi:hypothetical protein